MFFPWFQNNKTNKIGFEDVLYALSNKDQYILINTINKDLQHCLIQDTIPAEIEEKTINELMNQSRINMKIIIYGQNSSDENVDQKYKQLTELGFREVYIYGGGLFEWLLLQDIYSEDEFPTTTKVQDFLFYKQRPLFHIQRLK